MILFLLYFIKLDQVSPKYDWNKVLTIQMIWNSNPHLIKKKLIHEKWWHNYYRTSSKNNGLYNSVEHAEIVSNYHITWK